MTEESGRGVDAASDADTDDLIVSGIELLSEASLLIDQRPPDFFSVSGQSVSAPVTPESEQLPRGASASYITRHNYSINTSARRSLQFGEISSAKKNADQTDQAPRSCLKAVDSPSKTAAANLSVSFSVDMPRLPESHDGSHDEDESACTSNAPPLAPIVAKHVQKLEAVFDTVREDFGRLSRLSELSSEADSKSFALPLNNQEKAAEDAFVKTLSKEELRQLLEAETMKRRHCERKIEMLNRRCLQLEQRLSIADTHVGVQRQCLDQVETDVKALTNEFCDREKQRLALCEEILKENVNLKENVALSAAHSQALNRRLEDAEKRLQTTSQALSTERQEGQNLRFQCDSLTQNLERLKHHIAEQNVRIDQLEKRVQEASLRETELTKEYMTLDGELKKTQAANRRLATELNVEKVGRRLDLEQKETEFTCNLRETESRAEKRLATTTEQLKKAHEEELLSVKDACEKALRASSTQTDLLKRERDHLAAKLDHMERDLDFTQQQMAAELQHKLAAKYQELLNEFGYHHEDHQYTSGGHYQGGAAGGTTFWSQHGNPTNYGAFGYTGNLAQEFLSDLGQTHPITTPRSADEHGAGFGTNVEQVSVKRAHLQGVLKQVLPSVQRQDQRLPPANQGHPSLPHPTDPAK